MRALNVAVACCTVFVAGCSWTPSLEETTGTSDPPIFIGEVVQRVKCELNDTARSLRTNRKAAWASNWAAKVNLTLTVANTGALTPSVQTIKVLPNAYYQGVSAATAKALGVVSTPEKVLQKFAFGANLTLQEVATRTELIVFSVRFSDLIDNPSEAELKDCDKITGRELRGGLGLQQWVDSAFSPLEKGQLLSGSAPAFLKDPKEREKFWQSLCAVVAQLNLKNFPNCAGAAAPDLPNKWQQTRRYLKDPCVYKEFLAELDNPSLIYGPRPKNQEAEKVKKDILPLFSANTECRPAAVLYDELEFADRLVDAKNKVVLGTVNDKGERADGYVPAAAKHFKSNIMKYQDVLRGGEETIANLAMARRQLGEIEKFFASPTYDFTQAIYPILSDSKIRALPDCGPVDIPRAGAKLDLFPPDGDCQIGYSMVISANAFLRNVENLTILAKQLAAFITTFAPVKPIDSVTHTVQFVVTYGVGIQPNWTLIQS